MPRINAEDIAFFALDIIFLFKLYLWGASFSLQAFLWLLLTAICLLLVLAGLRAGMKRAGWAKKGRQFIFIVTAAAFLYMDSLITIVVS